jgi:hypothetical protein
MDIWKVKLQVNNAKIAQGSGRTAGDALADLEKSLKNRRDGYRRQKK